MRTAQRALLCAGAVAVLASAGAAIAGSHYRLGMDTAAEPCLPHRLYLIELGRVAPIKEGLVAFGASGLEPFFQDGAVFTKMVIGLPGDRIEITDRGVLVGEQFLPFNRDVAAKLEGRFPLHARTYQLGHDELFVGGTNPRAFDSRYYGPIKAGQLVGTARPVW